MTKRKRELEDASHTPLARKARKELSVSDYYAQSKRSLQRALKVSKNFERQKLGKRLKLAKTKSAIPEIERINREIEVLKSLDLDKVATAHLNKCLSRIKAFKDSDGLPDELTTDGWKPEGSEEMIAAGRNVVSGMCNMKQVKEVVDSVLQGMYEVLGIKKPVGDGKQPPRANSKDFTAEIAALIRNNGSKEPESIAEAEELAWEGFSSSGDLENDLEEDEGSEGGAEDDNIEYQSLSDTEISRYEGLLGDVSSEEVSDDDIWARIRASISLEKTQTSSPPSVSLSSELLENLSDTSVDSKSGPRPGVELSSSKKVSSVSKSKSSKKSAPAVRSKTSTFLPTLMGGYWSGTESSASDIEDTAARPPIRKNRPGQAARRAIWEKKYKSDANHIKSGQGSVNEKRDAGWDAQRGAQGEFRRGERGNGRGKTGGWRDGKGLTGRDAEGARSRSAMTEQGNRGAEKKRDDSGVLHPSWQAAKKAKTMEKTAKFEGKKMTFA